MKLIVANLKMNLSDPEVSDYLKKASQINSHDNKLIICPSSIYLSKYSSYHAILGCQNIFHKLSGSYTGKISLNQVLDYNINNIIVNHSESVIYDNDNNSTANEKLKILANNQCQTILCVGDSYKAYLSKKSIEEILKQLDKILENISDVKNIVIAYEPLYAIGTNITPKLEEISNIKDAIKRYFKEKYNEEMKVIYGGSVNDDNYLDIINIPGIDGLIIGNYILDVNKLEKILKNI